MAASKRIDPEPPAAESTLGLGARLTAARETQQLALEEVAAELRISVASLKALEDERFDALGAPVFAKGYLKQYGARLGLDVPQLVAQYDRSPGNTRVVIAPSRTIHLRDESQITVWIVAAIALIVVIVVIAFWWLGQGGTLFG